METPFVKFKRRYKETATVLAKIESKPRNSVKGLGMAIH
jgi:hypothetical protein